MADAIFDGVYRSFLNVFVPPRFGGSFSVDVNLERLLVWDSYGCSSWLRNANSSCLRKGDAALWNLLSRERGDMWQFVAPAS